MRRFFGTPDGIRVGQQFIDRRDAHENFAHRPLQGGISGTKAEGADSIVVSGGYIDDEDHGDYLIYTGQGGKDPNSNRQISDQSAEAPGNAGLVTSMVRGLPVRVIRGPDRRSPYAPLSGYVYAGLFTVTNSWKVKGVNGYLVMRFKLERLPEQPALITREAPEIDPQYAVTTISRRVRDSALAREVKAMYSNCCQACGTAVPGIGNRFYSEGAHVRPLGRPHLGQDHLENLLCLCPNHHSEMDLGGMVILDDFRLAHTSDSRAFSELSFRPGHTIDGENVRYQRQLWMTI